MKETLERNRKMIKTCVSSYSFGREASEDRLGTLGVIEKAKEMGYDGIEFVESEYTTPEKAHLIKEKCREVGPTLDRTLKIPSFLFGLDNNKYPIHLHLPLTTFMCSSVVKASTTLKGKKIDTLPLSHKVKRLF